MKDIGLFQKIAEEHQPAQDELVARQEAEEEQKCRHMHDVLAGEEI